MSSISLFCSVNKDKDIRVTKENRSYVINELRKNPNLFCWMKEEKNDNTNDNIIDEMNIQDIPDPKEDEHSEEILEHIIDEIKLKKQRDSLLKAQKEKTLEALVSVDDPKKYDIVKQFIKDRGLKIYGGVAINSFLPDEDKFYDESEIPDYDVFSPNPWQDAVDLADKFYEKGYKFIEAKAGIHKGTYKVYVEMWPVADITFMPPEEFKKIKTTIIDGLQVVGPFKLLESMYKEFSEPYVNASRWTKVSQREKLLQRWLKPLNDKFNCSVDLFTKKRIDDNLAKLLDSVYNFSIRKKLVFSGAIAYNTFLELGGSSRRVNVNSIQVLSENAKEDIMQLFPDLLKINKNLEITTRYIPSRELNNNVYNINLIKDNKLYPLCEIVHLTSCTPYKELLGKIVVSIDYLKYDLYDNIVFADSPQESEDSKCKIQYLTKIQNNYYNSMGITELDNSPFQRFVIDCRGIYNEGMKVELMNRWLEKMERAKTTYKEYRNGFKIVKTPIVPIPKECNVGKDKCKYPCFWNRYIGKCTAISKGSYRPENGYEEE